MKIIKPERSEVVYRTLASQRGDNLLSIGLMTLFPLHPEVEIDLTQPGLLWDVAQQALGSEGTLDEGWPKSRSEFLVYGNAYAPLSSQVQPISVSARVGDVTKRLAVFGDRKFNALGMISSPEPFSRMPIVPETAFGGDSFLFNPDGKGVREVESKVKGGVPIWPLPNVEYPSKLMVQRDDQPSPAGFWALAANSAQRKSLLGTFDKKWLDKRWPHLPVDTDPDYFQVAPEDQRFGGFLQGNELIELENMHARIPHIESRLPALRARVFVEQLKSTADIEKKLKFKDSSQTEFVEISTRVETVWLLPELLCGIVLHRAILNVKLADADDVMYVYATMESLHENPLSAAEHQNKFDTLVGRTVEAELSDTLSEDGSEPIGIKSDVKNLSEYVVAAEPEITVEPSVVKGVIDQIETELIAESPELVEMTQKLQPLMEKFGVTQKDIEKMLTKDSGAELTFSELRKHLQDLGPKLFEAMKNLGLTEADVVKRLMERPDLKEDGYALSQFPNGLKGVFEELDKEYAELIEEEKQIDERMVKAAADKKAQDAEVLTPTETPEETDARLLATDLRQLVITRYQRKRDMKGLDLSGVDLSDLTLEGADFSGATLVEANFEKSRLQNCRFDEALLSHARFASADLSGASLQEVSAPQTDFTSCRMVKANLTRSDFSESIFQKAQISEAIIAYTDFSRSAMQDIQANGCRGEFAGFIECQLTTSNFSDADLRGVNFTGANLQQANLSNAKFKRGVLYSANFTDVVFNQAFLLDSVADEKTVFNRAKMIETDFSGAVWNGSKFDDVDMSRAQMNGADLTGAQINNVRMIRAVAKNLTLAKASIVDADVTGINLFEGSVANARLMRCKLQLANFFGVDFSDAVLESCDLEGSVIDRTILQVRGQGG